MGIGTLIIFIALLLVAAVAAGVLIQTAGSLQERALTTGDQAKGQISTNVKVVEVSATDGQDGTLEAFEETIRLSPGSNAIKLDQALLTMNSYDRTATLTYRGTTGTTENDFTSGFYTLSVETLGNITETGSNLVEDYDLDGVADEAYLNAAGNLRFNFSGGTTLTVTDFECTGAVADQTGTYTVTGSDEVASIAVGGSCGNDNTGTASINVTPKLVGNGFFSVKYLQRGTNPVDGNLQSGDVIKLYYEAPRAVSEDEEIRINFVPKIGTPTLTQFITPEVLSTERVYLYP
jgi:archaellin